VVEEGPTRPPAAGLESLAQGGYLIPSLLFARAGGTAWRPLAEIDELASVMEVMADAAEKVRRALALLPSPLLARAEAPPRPGGPPREGWGAGPGGGVGGAGPGATPGARVAPSPRRPRRGRCP